MGWDGMEWVGSGWDGVEMGWDGVRWVGSGVGLDGMGWRGGDGGLMLQRITLLWLGWGGVGSDGA